MKKLRLLPALLLLATPSIAAAQWFSDSTTNTPICNLASSQQDHPAICSDGANGAVVVWQDTRNGGVVNIYAQRIDAAGRPLWTANGIRVCTPHGSNAAQRTPVIASDDAGGAYVVWLDQRNASKNGTDLYGQHIAPNGTLVAPDTGILICDAARDQINPVICADGRGGAFVVWEDNRATNLSDRLDLYFNHLSNGSARYGSFGSVVTDARGTQRNPAICEDGNGGCYIAWENGNTLPYSIWANHIDANGNARWDASSSHGFQVFRKVCGDCSSSHSTNVAIRRDGEQLMLAWQTANYDLQYGQDIMATRIRGNNPSDTVHCWSMPVEVTGQLLRDQVSPDIFSDDVPDQIIGVKGIIVPYENLRIGSATDDYDVCMVHLLGDGNAGAGTTFDLVRQPHAQNGFHAVKMDSVILAVWNDARYEGSPDTCIFAQAMSKSGNRYFPTYKTTSKLAQPICHSGTNPWNAKQVQLAPRTNGGIAVWTDYRRSSSDADIYAQLIFRDGSLPVELESFNAVCKHRGDVDVSWKTANEHSNAGFEIERRMEGQADFEAIASYTTEPTLRGAGSSDIEHSYAWVDRSVEPAVYEYRLVEVALDGSRQTHNSVRVDATNISGTSWSLGANYPNPFARNTTIPVSLATDAIVDLSLVDVTGRMIASIANHQAMSAGEHDIAFTSNNLPAGSYFVNATAFDSKTGALLWRGSKPISIK